MGRIDGAHVSMTYMMSIMPELSLRFARHNPAMIGIRVKAQNPYQGRAICETLQDASSK
ncbi:hypothetical protein ACTWPF_00095 [Oceanobacillus sp. M65]|uniref:hypothetical protein n=1 Tax=Oceanobacillus sp. M65 TaxID=3457435 RepID=UPI003FCD2254